MPGQLLGAGNMAEVFLEDGHVLKLYRAGVGPAGPAAELVAMAVAAEHGLPVPAVIALRQHEGRWGIAMSRAEGVPLAHIGAAGPTLVDGALATMARLQVAMHGVRDARLPPLKPRLAERIGRAPELGEARRAELRAQLAALPDGQALCHGDFHPLNLIGAADGRVTIIDWADATTGPAAADACRSYLILLPVAPDVAEAYLDAYVSAAGVTRQAILAWLPCLAAARLCEEIADQADLLLELAAR
jgi:Ser/Thr protein kinase RdoA (MazF antagonist)